MYIVYNVYIPIFEYTILDQIKNKINKWIIYC